MTKEKIDLAAVPADVKDRGFRILEAAAKRWRTAQENKKGDTNGNNQRKMA